MIQDITVILGNQLCEPSSIKSLTKHPIFMCESDDLCTHYKYHKLKLLFFLTAMRDYRDSLIQHGFTCYYHSLHNTKENLFLDILGNFCKTYGVKRIHMLEIEDHFFHNSLLQFCKESHITLVLTPSPLFLTSHSEFKTYLSTTKRPFMKTFYQRQRKKLRVLIHDNKPVGGKWSFDEENRKKTPKEIHFPSLPSYSPSMHLQSVKDIIDQKFTDHIGEMNTVWFPTNRENALHFLSHFMDYRLEYFGDYEDAIDCRSQFLFHSGVSLLLNTGLLTPSDILDTLESYYGTKPLNCTEGFIRQVIGWREFIRGIYHNFDDIQQSSNFFSHHRQLTDHWYSASTGILPLDDAISDVISIGYTHHINRLMVIGNIMLLTQIHPKQVYRWFMECFVDSSDWVMGPNVFGMSQFSDGGIFATKPYFCGSNYIRKMSHYKKASWCDTVDALYWRFIKDHQDYFMKNYRLKFMVSKLNSFSSKKIDTIYNLSNCFIEKVSSPS